MNDRRPSGHIEEAHTSASIVRTVTDRVAQRLIEAIEHDAARGADRAGDALANDERRQQLLIGSWVIDEIAAVNEERLQRGDPPLATSSEQQVKARVVAELTGAGPLEPYVCLDMGVVDSAMFRIRRCSSTKTIRWKD